MLRLTDVVKNLIIINVIIFFGMMTLYNVWPEYVILANKFPVQSSRFYPFQLVTAMFMHADIQHLFMNMIGLFFLGPTVELTLGPKRFLILYILSGLGASFLGMGLDTVAIMLYGNIEDVAGMGASACVYGVLIAFVTMLPNEKLTLFPIPIQVRSLYIGLALVGYAIYAGFTDQIPGGVDHLAHLGGAIVGAALIHYWKMANLR